jgi:hypothetical protein
MVNVFGIKSPIDDALLAAMYGRLCSVVYSALNDARESSEEPKRFRKHWNEIGGYELAKALVFSASHDCSSHPAGSVQVFSAWAESFCSVGAAREVGVRRNGCRNVRLNPHPSHETKARMIGPCLPQAGTRKITCVRRGGVAWTATRPRKKGLKTDPRRLRQLLSSSLRADDGVFPSLG